MPSKNLRHSSWPESSRPEAGRDEGRQPDGRTDGLTGQRKSVGNRECKCLSRRTAVVLTSRGKRAANKAVPRHDHNAVNISIGHLQIDFRVTRKVATLAAGLLSLPVINDVPARGARNSGLDSFPKLSKTRGQARFLCSAQIVRSSLTPRFHVWYVNVVGFEVGVNRELVNAMCRIQRVFGAIGLHS